MSDSPTLYEDRFGRVVHVADAARMEIHWTDNTTDISAEQFKDWLATYADLVHRENCVSALVDARAFRMSPDHMDMGWRDREIIPIYNAAGLKKFAFVMPAGMPAIGAPPAPEGPATFPTAYFSTLEEALTWLAD